MATPIKLRLMLMHVTASTHRSAVPRSSLSTVVVTAAKQTAENTDSAIQTGKRLADMSILRSNSKRVFALLSSSVPDMMNNVDVVDDSSSREEEGGDLQYTESVATAGVRGGGANGKRYWRLDGVGKILLVGTGRIDKWFTRSSSSVILAVFFCLMFVKKPGFVDRNENLLFDIFENE
jgi:hypothetical protein